MPHEHRQPCQYRYHPNGCAGQTISDCRRHRPPVQCGHTDSGQRYSRVGIRALCLGFVVQDTVRDRDAIIMELLHLLALEHGIGNVDEAYKAVLERENEIPSIIGPGIAVEVVAEARDTARNRAEGAGEVQCEGLE